VAQANVKLTVDASQATRALNGVQSQTNKLQSAFGGLRTAIAATGIGLIARNAVKAATDFEKLNQRLKILTKENGTYSESLKLAEEAQSKFGLSSIDALEGVTNLQARLAPLGSTMDEITAIFNGFNTAAILSGASAQEQAGAMRQLTQALGSGVLRGDEFNSISEQMSAVLKPIADQLGVNVGALRDMAAEGKITKDVVVAAFKEIEDQGAGALKELIKNDPTMTFKVLANQTEKLSISVGQILAPAILDATAALTKIVQAVDSFVKSPLGQTVAIFSAIAVAAKGVSVLLPVVAAGLQKVAFAGGVATIALNALPLVAVATGIGAIVTQLIKQREEQNKVTDAIKRGEKAQLEALEADLGIKIARQLAIINRSNDKRTIAAAERRLAILREQMKPIRERLDIVIQENAELEKANKLKKEALDKDKKLKEEAEKLKEKYMEIGKSVEEGIVSNLTDAVMGTKTLAQAAISVLNDLKRKLIEVAIQRAVSGIGAKIGGFLGNLFVPTPRANGGPVSAGGAYLVGERGPEILQMGSRGGNIIPNNAIGGGGTTNNMITVNVDATGSSVAGNGSEADQLGGLIASVVQATIIDEQRAGGLLNR
jgi:tape measure domain-containing protein